MPPMGSSLIQEKVANTTRARRNQRMHLQADIFCLRIQKSRLLQLRPQAQRACCHNNHAYTRVQLLHPEELFADESRLGVGLGASL